MKELNEIVTNRTVIKIQKITCNICGEEIKLNDFGYFNDYLSIEKRWGYGSKYDNEVHKIDICESCYDKFMNTLAIEAEIENRE